MRDKAHVRFVDAHAKRNGGDDDNAFLALEARLVLGPRPRIHAGMIGQGLDSLRLQPGSGFVDLAPRQAIDDSGIPGMLVSQEP